ncbi:DUF2451 domain containing protein [Nitzschia inconspicua]|uniref:DUF2451 domain containing protein n=1 Tax=Nitzschia inconspicua TaxID=303405 RepID=A0A9K3Q5U9_9STRA|nr:DUF2451 domain containing protein [Nitzschia inconspicua]
MSQRSSTPTTALGRWPPPPHPSGRSITISSNSHSIGNNNNNDVDVDVVFGRRSNNNIHSQPRTIPLSLPLSSSLSANPATRRLQVWMRQQWRGIPAATFDTKNANVNANVNVIRNQHKYQHQQPMNHNDNNNDINPNDTLKKKETTSNNINYRNRNTNTDSETVPKIAAAAAAVVVQVSNIDEALGALSCDYQIDPRQPNRFRCVGRRRRRRQQIYHHHHHHDNDDIDNDTTTCEDEDYGHYDNDSTNGEIPPPYKHDWVLDGHPEWYQQYQKTATLLEQLYPSSPHTKNHDDTIDSNQNSNNNNDDNNNNNNKYEIDLDTNLLLQFGSVMGQQEYQFASFPPVETIQTTQNETSTMMISTNNHDTPTGTFNNDDNNFAQFWQAAVTAPTPQHTFDMGSSSSTYATGEDDLPQDDKQKNNNNNKTDDDDANADVVDPIDAWLVEKMAAKALGTRTPPPITPTINFPSANLTSFPPQVDDDFDDDDDDFGDFQEAIIIQEQSPQREKNAVAAVTITTTTAAAAAAVATVDGDNEAVTTPMDPNDDVCDKDGSTNVSNTTSNLPNKNGDATTETTSTAAKNNRQQHSNSEKDEDRESCSQVSSGPERTDTVAQSSPVVTNSGSTSPRPPKSTDNIVSTHVSAVSTTSSETKSPTKPPFNGPSEMKTPTASPPAKSVLDERYSLREPPTPITRNYYPSPNMVLQEKEKDATTTAGMYFPSSSSPFPHQLHFQDRQPNNTTETTTANKILSPSGSGSIIGDHDDDEDDKDNDDESNESSTRGESTIGTHTTAQEQHSVPKEVQLKVPSNIIKERTVSSLSHSPSISIPQTVRVASTTTTTTTTTPVANFASPSFFFGRNASLFATSMLDGGGQDEPSIASSLASPEGKFLRRRRQSLLDGSVGDTPQHARKRSNVPTDGENDDGDDSFDEDESVSLGSLGTLPENYLKHPDMDYTLQELKKLEWDWLPFWKMKRLLDEDDDDGQGCDTSTIPLLQEQITQRLSKLDAFYRKVCKKVYKKIQPYAEDIIIANQAMLDLQKNLQLASMYLKRTQRAIEIAKYGSPTPSGPIMDGYGVYGAMGLLQSWDNLSSQKDLDEIIQSIKEIFESEDRILKRIQAFDVYRCDALHEYQSIDDHVEELRERCHSSSVSRLRCLDELRNRVDSIMSKIFYARLHECLEEVAVVVMLCGDDKDRLEPSPSDLTAYETIIECFCRLYQVDSIKEKKIHACSRAICTTIQTAMLLECQKAFGRALLWPSGSENDEDGPYRRELDALHYNERFLDATRIPNWTYNLVTIRFDFEIKDGNKHPLPSVFHKLCLLLTNILRSFHARIEWHQKRAEGGIIEEASDLLVEIAQELPGRRASLWNACIQSMEQCFEEYLKYIGNKRLFSWDTDICDDSNWFRDVQGLQESYALMNQFLSIGPAFLRDTPTELVNDGSLIREKFHLCCKRHVRTFHVETMNSLGGMLFREDWTLLPFPNYDSLSKDSSADVGIRVIECISKMLFDGRRKQDLLEYRSQKNGFIKKSGGYDLAKDLDVANPFDIMRGHDEGRHDSDEHPSIQHCEDSEIGSVERLFSVLLANESTHEQRVMSKSVLHGILPWCSRVTVLIEKLPFMAKEAILVLTNIFDLYITTAFRICAGNRRNERILLGMEMIQTVDKDQIDDMIQSRFSSQSFGFGRRPHQAASNSKLVAQVSKHVDAEMCAFVMSDENFQNLARLRDLILDGQSNLKSIVKLDLVDKWIVDPVLNEDTREEEFAQESARVLEKRVSCSFNLLSLAAALHVATKCLSSYDQKLEKYKESVLCAIPLFLDVTYRMSAMRSIRGRAIVMEIASNEAVWEESKLHEHPNDYIENLCDFSVLLWKHLHTSSSKLPDGVLNNVWNGIVGGSLMTFLEGFSKIPVCSTEGRSLMSMDVAAYSSEMKPRSVHERLGFDKKIPAPQPTFHPHRDASYVDTYIKMFYFPHTDVVSWVEDNYHRYHRHHIVPLVLATAPNANEARKALQTVIQLYEGKVSSSAKTLRL